MAPEAASRRTVQRTRTRLVQPALPLSFTQRVPTPKAASPVIDADASGGLEVDSEPARTSDPAIDELGLESQSEPLAIEDKPFPGLEQTVDEYHEKEVIPGG
jgi:hypothetical protein